MKLSRVLFFLAFLIILPVLPACSTAEKATKQRRNLMMPETSDLPSNSKYKPPRRHRTHKPPKQRRRNRPYTYIYPMTLDDVSTVKTG
jgi:hypothetical protein